MSKDIWEDEAERQRAQAEREDSDPRVQQLRASKRAKLMEELQASRAQARRCPECGSISLTSDANQRQVVCDDCGEEFDL